MKTIVNLRNAAGYCVVSLLTLNAFAQSTLEVKCYNNPSLSNSVNLNGNIIEYAVCEQDPAFYVSVFDPTTCSAWATNYMGSNPSHNFGNSNNDGDCKGRAEYYFVFQCHDSLQLAGMNTMINQIPAGYPYVIYTPISYSHAQVDSVNPILAQNLASRWDPAVVNGEEIFVVFGVQDNAGSFVEETTIHGDHITFITVICEGVTGVEEAALENLSVHYSGQNQLEISAAGNVDDVALYDINGRSIGFGMEGTTLTAASELSSGVYIVSGSLDHRPWSRKVAVAW